MKFFDSRFFGVWGESPLGKGCRDLPARALPLAAFRPFSPFLCHVFSFSHFAALSAFFFFSTPFAFAEGNLVVENSSQVQVDLTYSVESSTIASGVGAGNVAAWTLTAEQLAQWGLDPTDSIEDSLSDAESVVIDVLGTNMWNYIKSEASISGEDPLPVAMYLIDGHVPSNWLSRLQGVVYGSTNSQVLWGGSRNLGGAMDINVNTMLNNVGLATLESHNPDSIAPAVSVQVSSNAAGFSADEWVGMYNGVSDPEVLQATDFLPTLSSSGPVGSALAHIWNDGVVPACQDFFESASDKVLLIRKGIMLGIVALVGRRMFAFIVATGPLLLDACVSVITGGRVQSYQQIRDGTEEL